MRLYDRNLWGFAIEVAPLLKQRFRLDTLRLQFLALLASFWLPLVWHEALPLLDA